MKKTYRIIGAAMEVHKELGCGFLEAVYQEALGKEFAYQAIPFKPQPIIQIAYKGKPLDKTYQPDFICYGEIILEITERMLVEFGHANLMQKARQQPEKVKQVLDKVRSDGLMPTIGSVRNKLGQPLPLGYCNVGRVIDTADSFKCQVLGFKKG